MLWAKRFRFVQVKSLGSEMALPQGNKFLYRNRFYIIYRYTFKTLFLLKGHYDEVKYNSVLFSVLGMLSMLPIIYSKYSDRKYPHLMSSSENRISGNAFYVVYK